MSAPAQRQIRTNHPDGFRSGEWASLVNEAIDHSGRRCYLVRFADGASDWWVADDPDGDYEFEPELAA